MTRLLPIALILLAAFTTACRSSHLAGEPVPPLQQVDGAQTVHATARLGSGASVDTSQLVGLLQLRTQHVQARRGAYEKSGHYVYNVLLKDAGVTLRDDGSLMLDRGLLLVESTLRTQVAGRAGVDEWPRRASGDGGGGVLSLSAWLATSIPATPTITSLPVVLVAKPAPPLVVRPPIVAGSTGTRWAIQFLPGSGRTAATVRVFLRSTDGDSRVWVAPADDADTSPAVWLDDPGMYLEIVGEKFGAIRTLPLTPELSRMLDELDADGADLLVWAPPPA